MIVISDTSPITSLAAVGQLDLLRQLYTKILIPEAVYRELTGTSTPVPGSVEVSLTSGYLLYLLPVAPTE